jgi:hypothetical protein
MDFYQKCKEKSSGHSFEVQVLRGMARTFFGDELDKRHKF